MDYRVVTDYTNVSLENTNVKVYVRLRPPSDGTSTVDPNYIDCSEDQVRVTIRDPQPQRSNGEHAFAFDRVFHTEASQDILFRTVSKPQVDHILNGYNSCCFAYGQTGSGKTYSMFGEEEKSTTPGKSNQQDVQDRLYRNRGMIPRCIEYLVKRLKEKKTNSRLPSRDVYGDDDSNANEAAMMVSFLEIYCDQIRDLGKAYVQQQASGGEKNINDRTKDKINPTQTSEGMTDSINKKTSELFARLQSAKQESFARIKSSDPIHCQGDTHSAGHQGDNEFSNEVMRDTSMGPFMEPVYKDDYQAMSLNIREDPTGRVFVQDLACIPVSTVEEVMDVISLGLKLRATHETKMNQVSSRSHTVFTVTVMQKDASGEAIGGTLHLVDLAGSERLKKSESQGIRLKEAVHINSSLTALGKVVMALDPTIESSHIPYRDSKLTRILQNSLGGNSYTAVVATVNPINEYYEECLSSLQFANRCRRVSNQPRINYIGNTEADKDKRIKRLTEEVGMLTRRLKGTEMEIQQRILKILRDLGFNAAVDSSGLIDLGNGKKVGASGVVDEKQIGKNGRAGRFNLGNDLENQRMMKMIEEFKEQINDLTQKVKEKDSETVVLKDAMEKLKFRYDTTNRELQLTKANFQCETDKLKRIMRDHTTLSKSEFEATLKRALSNSNTLMAKATEMVTNLPSAMKLSSDKIRESKDAFNKGKQEEKENSNKILNATISSKDRDINLLKARYESWLEKKEKKMKFLLEEFSKYRQRKRKERNMYDKELLLLMNYSQSLGDILQAAEEGKYPIRQTQRTVSLLIPKSHRPAIDIMKDSSSISYTKRLMKRKENKNLSLVAAVENSKLAKLHMNASFDSNQDVDDAQVINDDTQEIELEMPETNTDEEETKERYLTMEDENNNKRWKNKKLPISKNNRREKIQEELKYAPEEEIEQRHQNLVISDKDIEDEACIPDEIKQYDREVMLYWRQRYKELRSSHNSLLRIVAKLREEGVVLPRKGVPLPSLTEVRGPKRLNHQTPVSGTIRKFFN